MCLALGDDGKLEQVYTSRHDPSDLILTLGLDGHIYAGERRYLGERWGTDVYESRLLRLAAAAVERLIPPTTDRTIFNAETIAVDRDGRVLFTDREVLRIRAPNGPTTVLELLPGPKAGTRPIGRVSALRWLPDGRLLVLDTDGVHRVSRDGRSETIADGLRERKPSDLAWRGANLLLDVARDAEGRACAYLGGRRIIRVEQDGSFATLLRTQRPWSAHALAIHGKRMWVLESSLDGGPIRPRIRLLWGGSVRVIFEGA